MVYCAATGSQYQVYMKLCQIPRKTSDSKDKFNGENPLDIAITNYAIANALELLRGQNFEN